MKSKPGPNLINAYINGTIIVLVALVVNIAVEAVGLETLHGFISRAGEIGLGSALSETDIVSLVFMFLLYPLILGAAVVANRSTSADSKTT